MPRMRCEQPGRGAGRWQSGQAHRVAMASRHSLRYRVSRSATVNGGRSRRVSTSVSSSTSASAS